LLRAWVYGLAFRLLEGELLFQSKLVGGSPISEPQLLSKAADGSRNCERPV